MRKIAVISASVRDGRLSHRVALFLKNYLETNRGVEAEILDLKRYNFPLFHERFINLKEPSQEIDDYVERFNQADGIVIVSPVYNGSFPAALKNVIDLLVAQWVHKPVTIVSVSSGLVPGIATVQQLQTLLLKMNARVAAPLCMVAQVGSTFTEDGTPADYDKSVRHIGEAIDELIWMVDKSKN